MTTSSGGMAGGACQTVVVEIQEVEPAQPTGSAGAEPQSGGGDAGTPTTSGSAEDPAGSHSLAKLASRTLQADDKPTIKTTEPNKGQNSLTHVHNFSKQFH